MCVLFAQMKYLSVDGHGAQGEELPDDLAAQLQLASEFGGGGVDGRLQRLLLGAATVQLDAECGFGGTDGLSVLDYWWAERDVHSISRRFRLALMDFHWTGQVFNPAGSHQASR